ncbi:hypothetical protein C2845_PM03G02760 [Panicum miliaceum]|uniref:Secreted protein n=1 Tax=Panicum miliaceum TaxID=4540 RepID=A0A3L6TB50_PANMI|nr:hypothetical protein C2845_PM03G02760 [Panicum miliaceum]
MNRITSFFSFLAHVVSILACPSTSKPCRLPLAWDDLHFIGFFRPWIMDASSSLRSAHWLHASAAHSKSSETIDRVKCRKKRMNSVCCISSAPSFQLKRRRAWHERWEPLRLAKETAWETKRSRTHSHATRCLLQVILVYLIRAPIATQGHSSAQLALAHRASLAQTMLSSSSPGSEIRAARTSQGDCL